MELRGIHLPTGVNPRITNKDSGYNGICNLFSGIRNRNPAALRQRFGFTRAAMLAAKLGSQFHRNVT